MNDFVRAYIDDIVRQVVEVKKASANDRAEYIANSIMVDELAHDYRRQFTRLGHPNG